MVQSGVALVCAAWILFALLIVMTWHMPFLESLIPKWMIKAIYPIDKTDLDMLRFTHFLALAVWCALFSAPLGGVCIRNGCARSILCGQHSLPIFCLGVFLSFSAHWILMQFTRGVWRSNSPSRSPASSSCSGAAWLLDRAERVPSLFVKVTDVDDEREAAAEGAPVTVIGAAPACR